MISEALPEVKANVVTIWANAIRYGEASHVRPFRLRGFFHAKGGLVRCGGLFQEQQEKTRAAEQIARLDAEDRDAGMKRARGLRRQAKVSIPYGMRSLYGP
jgi:hypothetical protein